MDWPTAFVYMAAIGFGSVCLAVMFRKGIDAILQARREYWANRPR